MDSFSQDEKQVFISVMTQVCQLQKNYGKSANDFKTMIRGFLWALDGEPMPLIINALQKYVRERGDIPTPSDILSIIHPPKPKQVMDRAVYVRLSKRIAEGEYLFQSERDFMRKFEDNAINGSQEEREEYERAQLELKKYHIEYCGNKEH